MWLAARLVLLYVKLVAAYYSAKGFQVESVAVDAREVWLGCWLGALCIFGWLHKRTRKIVLEKKKESMRSVPDWSVYSRIAWRGHWFAKGNRSVTATGSFGMILSFISDSFFFFLPYSLAVFFCLWTAARELKKEEKKQGYFYAQTLGFNDCSVVWMFSWTRRNSCVSQTRHWNILQSFSVKPDIGIVVRVFVNGPGDLGSIPGRVILKTQKMVLPCLTLSIIRYRSRLKWSNPGKGAGPFPTPWCCSYRKGRLRVTLDYGR